ncbi:MAG: O-methyltransferase [Bacteroidota bacterium]
MPVIHYSCLDEKLEQYIVDHSSPEDELLQELTRETHLKVMHPRMISGHIQGLTLKMLSRMIQPNLILEIGTYTGYSAICLVSGLKPGGMLHTIEINDELQHFASKYIKKAGLENKIKQHIGDAKVLISKIPDDIDLVFLDGDKTEYLDYYNAVFEKLKKGGYILADNVLWNGKVIDELKENDKFTRGILDFNEFVQKDPRVENVVLPLRDGIMICRKR